MKVSGSLVKSRRLNYGLSQRDLASGICAQATISLIENQNSCPSLAILHPVCHRLNLELNSIIEITKGVQDVEEAILRDNCYRANQIFRRIPLNRFKRHRHLDGYYCYQGLFALENSDYFNALYFFNKVITIGHLDSFYEAWANLGLGTVYFKRHDSEKALEFLENANQGLDRIINEPVNVRFKLWIVLRLRLGSLLGSLKRFKTSNLVSYKTVSMLVKAHSMYQMANVYKQLGQNYVKLDRVHHARLALKRARVFSYLYQSPGSLRELK